MRSPRIGRIQGFSHFAQVLLDVEPIDNLRRSGKQFLSQIPNPRRAIAEDHPMRRLLEATPLRFSSHPLRKLGGVRVGEIGRASCRERVENAEVGVSVKEKAM